MSRSSIWHLVRVWGRVRVSFCYSTVYFQRSPITTCGYSCLNSNNSCLNYLQMKHRTVFLLCLIPLEVAFVSRICHRGSHFRKAIIAFQSKKEITVIYTSQSIFYKGCFSEMRQQRWQMQPTNRIEWVIVLFTRPVRPVTNSLKNKTPLCFCLKMLNGFHWQNKNRQTSNIVFKLLLMYVSFSY